VLEADAFEAFTEKGIFDPGTAASFRVNVLERTGAEDAMAAYVRFRGREPSGEPLLWFPNNNGKCEPREMTVPGYPVVPMPTAD
jgi:Zn-dependent oligopeptidase